MCRGGGEGGESRQVPLPLCTWAHVWGPKKRREIVRRSVGPSFVASLFLLTSLGRRLRVLGRRLPARGGVEIMSLFR